MTALVVALILTWLMIAGMALAIAALARQVGVLHERLAPVGALTTGPGPEAGQPSPKLQAETFSGAVRAIGARMTPGRAQLLMFVSPTCPVCKKLIPIAQAFGRSERLDVLYIGDGDAASQAGLVERFKIDPSTYASSPEIGMAFQVAKLPYAVLIDDLGVIVAKGLVNSREHLESLIEARERGFANIQDYIQANDVTTLGA